MSLVLVFRLDFSDAEDLEHCSRSLSLAVSFSDLPVPFISPCTDWKDFFFLHRTFAVLYTFCDPPFGCVAGKDALPSCSRLCSSDGFVCSAAASAFHVTLLINSQDYYLCSWSLCGKSLCMFWGDFLPTFSSGNLKSSLRPLIHFECILIHRLISFFHCEESVSLALCAEEVALFPSIFWQSKARWL